MIKNLRQQQVKMARFLILHIVLVIIGPALITLYGGVWDYLIVIFAAALLLTLFDRHYGAYLFWSLLYLVYLVKQVILSNLAMAWLVMQRKPKLDPGIIAIPLTISTGLEITVLSLSIIATPGTLVVELGNDHNGNNILYVHALHVGDPEKFRAGIKNGFERKIIQISKGATP